MKVTYNWLKDFVEIKISPQALADKLTMAGLEVTSLEEKGGDFVFEIEITSNRPDWLSVIGIAREVATITGAKFRAHSVERIAYSKNRLSAIRYPLNAKILGINIENKKDCPLYTAKIIKDVKVGLSLGWLKKRLELIGSRSINNIVDITNYVLFELGEPLHAFDLDKLGRMTQDTGYTTSIIVRRAKSGEEIVTIDGIKRALDENILVIAYGETISDKLQAISKPVAIAGVMGGKDTEVTESTKNVLLEAAVFNPIIIRRGRQQLGLQSDSACRFERGVNLEIVERAAGKAMGLIQELSGGQCASAVSSGASRQKQKTIALNLSGANKMLGIEISPAKAKQILSSLGFKVSAGPRAAFFKVSVPAHRQDVNLEVDLIEELARIYGYENVPTTLPAVKPPLIPEGSGGLVPRVKNILVGLGLDEAITYSLIDKEILNSFGVGTQEAIEIMNPLSREQEVLRPTLAPGLIRCIAYNLNQKQGYINIFEISKSFVGSSAEPKEKLTLGIGICGVKSYLLEQGLIKEEASLLHLKGILEVLFERLGVEGYSFEVTDNPLEFALSVKQEKIGRLMQIQRILLDKFGIENKEVFVLELSLDELMCFAQPENKFTPWPKYPAVSRDISFALKEGIAAKEIIAALKEKGGPLLEDIKIADYYKGKQIPPGYRGLTISCLYRSNERTLTDEEVNPLHSVLYAVLAERFGAKIR